MTPVHRRRALAGLGRHMSDIVADQPAARTGGVIAGPRVVPFDAVPLAMLVADRSAGVLAVNDRWVALSGRPGPESLGARWLESLDACSAARLRAAVAKAAAGPAAVTLESPLAGRPARWILASYEWAGETLVGIAVWVLEETRAASAPGTGRLASVLEELASRCDDLEGLLGRLEAVASPWAPPACTPAGGAVGRGEPGMHQ